VDERRALVDDGDLQASASRCAATSGLVDVGMSGGMAERMRAAVSGLADAEHERRRHLRRAADAEARAIPLHTLCAPVLQVLQDSRLDVDSACRGTHVSREPAP
jgi:hypothetical protein